MQHESQFIHAGDFAEQDLKGFLLAAAVKFDGVGKPVST